MCKQCQKENPDYDPRESPLEQKLQVKVENSDLKESLQKRKEFNKNTDEMEDFFLKSQKKKKNSKKSKEAKQSLGYLFLPNIMENAENAKIPLR